MFGSGALSCLVGQVADLVVGVGFDDKTAGAGGDTEMDRHFRAVLIQKLLQTNRCCRPLDRQNVADELEMVLAERRQPSDLDGKVAGNVA
jgi:hypothetical protein